MMMMMMMMMMSRYGTDKLIQLVMEHSPAVYHYILYFQDRFSFALNPGTLGMMILIINQLIISPSSYHIMTLQMMGQSSFRSFD